MSRPHSKRARDKQMQPCDETRMSGSGINDATRSGRPGPPATAAGENVRGAPASNPGREVADQSSQPLSDAPAPARRAPAGLWLWLAGGSTTAILILAAGRYGYHRDELYFLTAGRHLAWGYPDQPPLTPLLAHLMSSVAPESLTVLRLPAALIGGVVVMLTGLIARELGAERPAQLLAAACMAVAGGTLAITHSLGTSTLDLLFWTVLTFLVVRLLRGADPRWWPAVGAVLGMGLQNKWLLAFFAVALILGLVIGGPRRILRSPWLWAGALTAGLIWAPNLIWQAEHGWPQLQLSSSIAAGGSTSSQPRYLFVPLELLIMSPVLVPIWGLGLCRLLGAKTALPRLKQFGAFGYAYLVLLIVFIVTGGKPYYLIGTYPMLFAAGAEPTVAWARRGRSIVRKGLLTTALVLSLVIDSIISLPVLPVRLVPASPVLALNPDVGETVGWPGFVETVTAVYRRAPPGSVILMGNYGEAGAVDRYGPSAGLPGAYSGHNGYGLWGQPPDTASGSAVVVGITEAQLRLWFTAVEQMATIDNRLGLDNDEQDKPVWLCTGQRRPWSEIWPSVKRLG